jgi:hypothetical protein
MLRKKKVKTSIILFKSKAYADRPTDSDRSQAKILDFLKMLYKSVVLIYILCSVIFITNFKMEEDDEARSDLWYYTHTGLNLTRLLKIKQCISQSKDLQSRFDAFAVPLNKLYHNTSENVIIELESAFESTRGLVKRIESDCSFHRVNSTESLDTKFRFDFLQSYLKCYDRKDVGFSRGKCMESDFRSKLVK